jgi:hypothetical protein
MQPSAAHARFWRWFDENKDRLWADVYGPDPAARDRAMSEVGVVREAQPGVVLEFGGPAQARPRTLIVSADGKPEHVDDVKELVASAPAMAGWKVVAFRPRMKTDDMAIELQGERVGPDDVWFDIAEGADGLALMLYVRGLTKANEQLRGLGASLLAEHSVGERDQLTLLCSLDIRPLPSTSAGKGWLGRLFGSKQEPPPAPESLGLRSVRELARHFDEAKARKYPPPGSLTIDTDKDWHVGQGTVDGAPTILRMHSGLDPVAGHPEYDQRLTVSIHYNDPGEQGLGGSEEEFEATNDLAERLRGSLKS